MEDREELSKAEVIQLGNEAKALKEDPTLCLAFDRLIWKCWEKFLSAQLSDAEVLVLHKQAVGIKYARGELQSFIDDAAVELYNANIDKEQSNAR